MFEDISAKQILSPTIKVMVLTQLLIVGKDVFFLLGKQRKSSVGFYLLTPRAF